MNGQTREELIEHERGSRGARPQAKRRRCELSAVAARPDSRARQVARGSISIA